MKLVSGKCLWKPRKLRRLRFFTKTIQLPWLWATGRAYIHRFICLFLGQCWVLAMWPCCAQLHWHRAIRHCISNEMRYDHLPLAIPAPKRTHHTTHSYPGTRAGDPDKFRECNVGLLPILISHSYPLTLPLTDGWSENSSVSGAPWSVPGHPTPRLRLFLVKILDVFLHTYIPSEHKSLFQ